MSSTILSGIGRGDTFVYVLAKSRGRLLACRIVKITVNVSPKSSVLDPQGAAVEHALHSLGLESAKNVRVGKTITIELDGEDSPDIREQLEGICHKFLVNPVIEDFTYTIE